MPEIGLLVDGKARCPSMQIRCLEYINLFPICIVLVLPPTPPFHIQMRSLATTGQKQGSRGAHEAAKCDI